MLRKGIIYLLIILTISFLLFSAPNTHAGGLLQSTFTSGTPTINGSFDPFEGEWPANYVLKILDQVDATLYVTNNNQSVFVMVDAASVIPIMDTTEDDQDHCSIYLYYNGKGIRVTVFGDDIKYCESTNSSSNPLSWSTIPCPLGVKAAAGFGPSTDTPSPDHRMYEFEIPLNNIGAAPGDTIYFASPDDVMNSLPYDYNGGSPRYNIWPPTATASDLTNWGQIHLATVPASVPTMSEWGMIIFTVLAGAGSVYCLRRRRRTES